ncbi:HlyD family efflux transporter periplasmic adaptor subunit [Tabrizicola sp.]|uniref:HlyD family efflux transporter periplasmic adaptor subunit n=1 Tax=Tabrizicola sp. TaxID=2005166 RepID=UPI0035B0B0F8
MRFTRILVGVAVLVVAVWILIGEQLAGVSADAVINARLSSVRAPVAGDVTLAPLSLGARVRIGDDLGSIEDARADTVRLADLEMEVRLEAAASARETSLVAWLQDQITALEARTLAYQSSREQELATRLERARARLELLEADPAGEAGDVPATLSQGQTENSGDPLLPGIALEYAKEKVSALEVELAALQSGVHLGDGYNDAPWSEQWRADLEARLAEHQSAQKEADDRLAAVTARLDAERLRVNRLTASPLRSSINGILWELRTESGENVQRGDELLKLVNCDSTIVTLSVTENIYNGLAVGDPATFRPQGHGSTFEGTIVRLAGSGAETVYRNLAVAPSTRHLERFDVAVDVPGLADDPDFACAIGRTGRVFFDARPLDWLRGMFDR